MLSKQWLDVILTNLELACNDEVEFKVFPIEPDTRILVEASNKIEQKLMFHVWEYDTIESIMDKAAHAVACLTDSHIIRNKSRMPEIKKVLFREPATIVFWTDGTKTVVKCQEGDKYNPEVGIVMAYFKKCHGNNGSYYDELKKWFPEEKSCDGCKYEHTFSFLEPCSNCDRIMKYGKDNFESKWGEI